MSEMSKSGGAEAFGIEAGPFEGTYESLRQYECPQWFRDAKLGFWAHWGPQCVPMYGDWYARNIYIEGSDQRKYHWRHYGHPSQVGYKDIIPLWRAENFDPEGLMDLYAAAGAKYFTAQANHHDNFDNWDSKHHAWNSVKKGPKKDICRLWADAARGRGLKFGLTEHLGATFKWWHVNKDADKVGPYAGVPYDGNDEAYEDLYLPNHGETRQNWYTRDPWWHAQWFKRIKDAVDQLEPDLLYSDGDVPFEAVGLNMVAHLYNLSARVHGTNQAVYTQKNTDPTVFPIGVLDIERGVEPNAKPYVWQCDTCVGGWFYDVRREYKTAKQVIEMLVDITAKNGNLLLNFPQRPDGALDEECLHILKVMADWNAVNGEGIYATRPWTTASEGPTGAEGGAFKEADVAWTAEDFRFTCKGDTVYAFQMAWPDDGKALVRALAPYRGTKVVSVQLLGHDGELTWTQGDRGVDISLPAARTSRYAHCFRIETSQRGLRPQPK